jgi:hypothetical protein
MRSVLSYPSGSSPVVRALVDALRIERTVASTPARPATRTDQRIRVEGGALARARAASRSPCVADALLATAPYPPVPACPWRASQGSQGGHSSARALWPPRGAVDGCDVDGNRLRDGFVIRLKDEERAGIYGAGRATLAVLAAAGGRRATMKARSGRSEAL